MVAGLGGVDLDLETFWFVLIRCTFQINVLLCKPSQLELFFVEYILLKTLLLWCYV